MYYCKTRYYIPEWCRWLNADSVDYLDPESINGLNIFAYCCKNPVMYYDPSGCAIDIIFDILSIGYSIYEVWKDPKDWKNWAWLAVDIGFAVVPFLTGSGGLKAVNKLDDINDISKITTKADDIVVIGQSMKQRVIPEAINLSADWYRGFDYYADISKASKKLADLHGYLDNMKFIAVKAFTGKKFIDIGMDVTRIGKRGIWFSKFIINSERFIASAFRVKNVIRAGYHFINNF